MCLKNQCFLMIHLILLKREFRVKLVVVVDDLHPLYSSKYLSVLSMPMKRESQTVFHHRYSVQFRLTSHNEKIQKFSLSMRPNILLTSSTIRCCSLSGGSGNKKVFIFSCEILTCDDAIPVMASTTKYCIAGLLNAVIT